MKYVLIAFLLCASSQLLGQNAELKKLMEEDQAVRQPGKEITGDDDRIKQVLELLAKGAAQTPEDKYNAALVLQHTPLTFCEGRIVAKSPYNFLLAHYLAKESYEAGYSGARELVAMSMDRYLTFTQGHQKYGTNVLTNQKSGKDEWVPIDRETPDSERAKYGVPPLATLLKQYPEQKTQNKSSTPGKVHQKAR